MDLKLKKKTVLITGASQGIGEGAARVFAAEGASIKLTARRGQLLDSLADQLRSETGATVETYAIDLAAPGAMQELADAAGDVDILVNNAGDIPGGNLQSIDEAEWRRGWELKVFGYINLCRIYYARMKVAGSGVIVNTIGNAGERYDADYISGTTGNASLMAFTRALGGPSLNDGVRVVGINPGPVDTPRIYKLLRQRAVEMYGDESKWEELQKRYPKERPASVPEICDAIAFMASDLSAYTSGTILTIDGGIASRSSII